MSPSPSSSSASPESLTALRALLANAENLGSLREVAERLVPERRHALLRRAAIPVVFDVAMVRVVMVPRLPAPREGESQDDEADIRWLLGHSDIEPLGGATPLYRMRADVRGAFYYFVRVKTTLDSMTLAERLVREHKVAIVPGEAFGVTDVCSMRVSFGALDEATVDEGLSRLTSGIKALA